MTNKLNRVRVRGVRIPKKKFGYIAAASVFEHIFGIGKSDLSEQKPIGFDPEFFCKQF